MVITVFDEDLLSFIVVLLFKIIHLNLVQRWMAGSNLPSHELTVKIMLIILWCADLMHSRVNSFMS